MIFVHNGWPYYLFRFVSICFVSFCFVSFRFVSFRFDLFRFVSICFVSFRFCFVSHFTGTLTFYWFVLETVISRWVFLNYEITAQHLETTRFRTVLVLKTFTFLSYPILHATSSIQHPISRILHPTYGILHPAYYIKILSIPILSYPTLSKTIFKFILVETKIQCLPTIILYISLVINALIKERFCTY